MSPSWQYSVLSTVSTLWGFYLNTINLLSQFSLSTFSWRKPSAQRIKQPEGKGLTLCVAEVSSGPDIACSSRPRLWDMATQWVHNGCCNGLKSDETLSSLNLFMMMMRPEGWGIVQLACMKEKSSWPCWVPEEKSNVYVISFWLFFVWGVKIFIYLDEVLHVMHQEEQSNKNK